MQCCKSSGEATLVEHEEGGLNGPAVPNQRMIGCGGGESAILLSLTSPHLAAQKLHQQLMEYGVETWRLMVQAVANIDCERRKLAGYMKPRQQHPS